MRGTQYLIVQCLPIIGKPALLAQFSFALLFPWLTQMQPYPAWSYLCQVFTMSRIFLRLLALPWMLIPLLVLFFLGSTKFSISSQDQISSQIMKPSPLCWLPVALMTVPVICCCRGLCISIMALSPPWKVLEQFVLYSTWILPMCLIHMRYSENIYKRNGHLEGYTWYWNHYVCLESDASQGYHISRYREM